MKCDLHVHTVHSGMCTVPVFKRICRESYSDPDEVYATLKRRGMDLVTVTDHDSIDSSERLRRHPDFFLSEEVTCHTSRGTELHVGVYDIQERDHVEIQRRRDDLAALFAYLNERELLFSINHAFSGLTGSRAEADFDDFAEYFPAVEVLNGQMLPVANGHAETFAARHRKIALAGSDSHTIAGLGRTYTQVQGARDSRRICRRPEARPDRGFRRGGELSETTAGGSRDFLRNDRRAALDPCVSPAHVRRSAGSCRDSRPGTGIRASLGTSHHTGLPTSVPELSR